MRAVANQVRAEDFAFTKDVLPLDADQDTRRAPPTLLLPRIQEQLGVNAMDEDLDVDDDEWLD